MPDHLTRDRNTALAFYGCVFLLGYLLYQLFAPFLMPLAWAAIFGALFHGVYSRLEQRFGRTPAASLATAGVGLIIVVPLVLVGMAFVDEAAQTLGSAEVAANSSRGIERLQGTWSWLQRQRFGRDLPNLDEALKQGAASVGGFVAQSAGILVRNALVVVVNVVIMLFALFFFFRDSEAIMNRLRRVLPFEPSFREARLKEAADLIHTSVSSGMVVALVQGAIGGVAFAVLGLGAPVFWGVVMAFFSLLPLGAWIIWLPVVAWLLLTGETGRGIGLLVVGAGGISLVDNILRPMLLSGRTQMSGLLVFISLLGGMSAFGLIGLVLGPVIMATAISTINAYAPERREAAAIDDVPPTGDRRSTA